MTQRKPQGGSLNFFSSKPLAAKTKKDENVKNLRKPIERLRESLLLFITHQVEFERNFENSQFRNLDEYIKNSAYSPTSIFVNCENNYSLVMESLTRWYMNDYKNENLVIRNNHRIMISLRKKSDVKIKRCYPIGSFCLPPSKGADTEEVRVRLKRVCSVLGFGLQQNRQDRYIATFSSMDVAARLNDILLKMGWNSSIMDDEFDLLIKI